MIQNLLWTLAVLLIVFPLSVHSQVATATAKDTPYGVEATTGVRTSYIYRGFELSETTLDFQLEGEINLAPLTGNDLWLLNFGGWYAAGADDFSQFTAFGELHRRLEDAPLDLSMTLSLHDFDRSTFRDGLDLAFNATYSFNEDWKVIAGIAHDFAANGWYGNVEGRYSRRLSDKAYLGFLTGISAVSHYYGRDGLNNVYSRLDLTYNINSYLSITPYLATTIGIEEAQPDEVFTGFWFSVIF